MSESISMQLDEVRLFCINIHNEKNGEKNGDGGVQVKVVEPFNFHKKTCRGRILSQPLQNLELYLQQET
jgi:hypothetical protein